MRRIGGLSRFGRFLPGDRNLAERMQIVPWSGMISGSVIGALSPASFRALVSIVALVTLFIPRSLQCRFSQRLTVVTPTARLAK
ncbi:hypothetical protein [Rhizobium sp. AB2/73]|uniref:hypothetical protein n=1 Tax=Rhizobium sp. AB2/73 TaxID=2795216 RepID=UPI001C5ED000|nr:hypothetical protein [Rhizobium sp. AB2/73]QYA13498.1 hypothetical protein J5284_04505 [Rhizobium sp. AB2/73]UEQ80570.1 hypothetical protein I8E17_17490 [Rhizobium sp. AB2/73]